MSRSEDLKGILEKIRSGSLAPDSALHRYRAPEGSEPTTQQKVADTDVAIVGVAGRYPGARDLDAFWEVLRDGTDCVSEVPEERWAAEDYYSSDPRSPGRSNSKWGGFLSAIDEFDAPFFSISPREAEMMDPQQRLFLQEAWTALEEAGYGGAELDKLPCGVFVGTGPGDYYRLLEEEHIDSHAYSFMGNAPSILAARIAYLLNLRGASIVVDTACSSSLVATHLACESLRRGECKMALAGGVSILVTPQFHLLSGKAGMLSPDGRCRAFDDRANGFVPAEGVGVIVLKRLQEALDEGDHIHAVIRGTGTNQDGRTTGITAPSAPSQAELEKSVYRKFDIDPDSISYIECHGTGTKLGDPIEIQGLSDAFRDCEGHRCAVGSVKSNIGHALTAAGIAGITKAMLCLKHRQLVPSIHVSAENRHIDFSRTPFFVNKELREWEAKNGVRRVGVSSFGFSGTNAHVVLEEAPEVRECVGESLPAYPIPISGATEEACRQRILDLGSFLNANPEISLHDLAFTLSVGRNHFRFRCCLLVESIADLRSELREAPLSINDSKEPNEQGSEQGSLDIVGLDLSGTTGSEFKSRLQSACKSYVSGRRLDWKQLFVPGGFRRLSLPTYPFEKRQYWVPQREASSPSSESRPVEAEVSEKVSETYSIALTGDEAFLCDHVISGQKMLPGMGYVALLKDELGWGQPIALADILFRSPAVVNQDPVEVELGVETSSGEGDKICEFRSVASNRLYVSLSLSSNFSERPSVDVEECVSEVDGWLTTEQVYQRFADLGVDYGPSFRVVKRLGLRRQEVIARLELSSRENGDSRTEMVALLDGALQSVIGLVGTDDERDARYLPARVKKIEFGVERLPSCAWAVARFGKVSTTTERSFDIELLDDAGKVLVVFEEFVVALLPASEGRAEQITRSSVETIDTESLERFVLTDLKRLVSVVLKLPTEDVSAEDDLSEYGFDSITLTELSNEVLDLYEIQLSAALFFEHPTLASFVGYLLETYQERLVEHYGLTDSLSRTPDESPTKRIQETVPDRVSASKEPMLKQEPIAVVGMAGKFPGCDSLEEYWEALVDGRDLTSEVPESRWRWQDCFGDPQKEVNKTRVKNGGFLAEVDRFDAAFFGISPREAELMDPQHRLFLETVWHALEDAAICPKDLGGTRTGVFVGIASQDYKEILGENGINIDAYAATGMAHCLAANRVSYLLDLKGPSEAIDTACSSSLVAVHRGLEALRDGSCDTVVAGGVNLLLTPSLFISFDRAGMLSPDGHCKPFDQSANGYARGEGAGVVILKRLSQAQADGDLIHAIIRGSGVNHGGKANSLTAPNPNAQASLLVDTYRRAGIDPADVSYIEAHGTGTRLGDPIEFNGLKKAFAQLSEGSEAVLPEHSCAVGSVKSNIGHLETAAGIAGLLKVVLALKHRTIPKTLHFQEQNSHIELARSPFFVVDETRRWSGVVEEPRQQKRLAGVSSFGFGGANAHVILEEFVASESNDQSPAGNRSRSVIVPLSARNEEALQAMVKRLQGYLETHSGVRLPDLAFSLQRGRQALRERVAFLCSDLDSLKRQLSCFLDGTSEANLFTGRKGTNGIDGDLLSGVEAESFFSSLAANGKWAQLARLWVSGVDVPWPSSSSGAKKISLPGYPFQRERFWYEAGTVAGKSGAIKSRLHPLVAENISTFREQCYRLSIGEQASIFADHVIGEGGILPAAAHLELARFAGENALQTDVCVLSEVSFQRALPANEGESARVSAFPENETEGNGFEIWREGKVDGTRVVFTTGKFGAGKFQRPGRIDLESINSRCDQSFSPEECYEKFRAHHVNYGTSFQVLRAIKLGENELVAELSLGGDQTHAFPSYRIVPEILDGAWQATALLLNPEARKQIFVPRRLERLTIWEALGNEAVVVVRRETTEAGEPSFEAMLCDLSGNVQIHMEGLVFQSVGNKLASAGASKPVPVEDPVVCFEPSWEATPLAESAERDLGFVLFAGEQTELNLSLQPAFVINWSDGFEQASQGYRLRASVDGDYEALLKDMIKEDRFPEVFVFTESSLSGDLRLLALVSLCRAWVAVAPKQRLRLVLLADDSESALVSGVAAFARTLAVESSLFSFKSIGGYQMLERSQLAQEFRVWSEKVEVLTYRDRQRFKSGLKIRSLAHSGNNQITLRENGCYLITGGAGQLGLLFARYLAKRTAAAIVLTGRSELEGDRVARVESLGENVLYRACDVSSEDQVKRLIRDLRQQYGALHGVLHSAGFTQDGLFRQKSADSFRSVLEPKIQGTVNLDTAIGDQPLDFFVLFSSLAAVLGNPGQSDYAAANGFMDGFAREREAATHSGNRHGRTLSVNWPLWANGGMQINAEKRRFMLERFGIDVLSDELGVQLLTAMLSAEGSQLGVVPGDPVRISEFLGLAPASERPAVKPVSASSDGALDSQLEAKLLQIVGQTLKIEPQLIDVEEDLGDYGFDSISLTEFGNAVNETFDLELSPSLFFEYRNLRSFVRHLVSQHRSQLEQHFGNQSGAAVIEVSKPNVRPIPERARFSLGNSPRAQERSEKLQDIAIVGMSGVFPQSPDLNTFWRHLMAGRDLISEIPSERWNWREYCSERADQDRVDLKFGGFIPEIDCFDAAFFGIAPHEARLMDPQHRLFLQLVWQALENGGIAPSSLSGTNAGLYVGVANFDYNGLIKTYSQPVEAHELTGTAHSILANRISYLLDIHGPSEPIDTACSSSLVAIDRGVEAIRSGRSDVVIAGGVNVLLSPEVYLAFSKAGMLSSDGRCKAFDSAANGYVRGEGGGVVILKSLEQAVTDGNPIHAVIKASGVNHGGKAQSLTAPNPKAQSNLIRRVYEDASLPLESIGYIEAHGTGTPLGDPVEMSGLKQAFAGREVERDGDRLCGVGTVKSNIGHLETAAGIAGVLKLVLALQHKSLPASLHYSQLNPHIDLNGTPFYVVDEEQEWRPLSKPKGGTYPRRAGVSSFGFGGVNAHVVLEEAPESAPQSDSEGGSNGPEVLILSARSEDAVREQARQLAEFLITEDVANLLEVAYTLQTGRDAMRYRMGFLAADINKAVKRLTRFAGGDLPEGVIYFDTRSDGEVAGSLVPAEAESEERFDGHGCDMLRQWVGGKKVDWRKGYPGTPRLRSLPTYPFAKTRFWLEKVGSDGAQRSNTERVSVAKSDGLLAEPEELPIGEFLVSRLAAITGLSIEEVDADTELADLGVDSILGMQLLAEIENRYQLKLYPNELMDNNTVARLGDYLTGELERIQGAELASNSAGIKNEREEGCSPIVMSETEVSESPPKGEAHEDSSLIGPLVFVLSAPRSGSTLFRVMLDGHPKLYAPPELHLLPFRNMKERAERLAGRDAFLKEGLVKTVMDLKGLAAEEAQQLVAEWERDAWSIAKVYRELQCWIGDRTLVDKSPSYGMDLKVLERANELKGNVRFVHLLRHPVAVLESLVRNRFDRLLGTDESPWEFANQIWCRYNENIESFLTGRSNAQVMRLYYEDLVSSTRGELSAVCHFLGFELHPDMLTPYRENESQDGVHAVSTSIGDPNFNKHSGVDSSLANWPVHANHLEKLSGQAVKLAYQFGYSIDPAGHLLNSVQLDYLSDSSSAWFIVQETKVPVTDPDPKKIQAALIKLCEKHELLGWCLNEVDGRWRGRNGDVLPRLEEIDWSELASAETEKEIHPLIERIASTVNLSRGPLFGAALITRERGEYTLLIVIHHAIADGVSLGLFLSELWQLYRDPQLEVRKDRSYLNYSLALSDPARFQVELDSWRPITDRPLCRVPVDFTDGANDYSSERTFEMSIDLRTLVDGSPVNFADLLPALMIAVGQRLGEWNDTSSPTLALRLHRRSGLGTNFGGVLGCFAGDVPWLLDLANETEFSEVAQAVQAVPSGGNGYGVLVAAGELPAPHELTEVRLNFQPLGGMEERVIRSTVLQASESSRRYLLDLIVRVGTNRCLLLVRYSENRHRRETIDQIVRTSIETMKNLMKMGNRR